MQNASNVLNNATDDVTWRSQTIEGFEFNPGDNVWRIATPQGSAVFNFDTLPAVTGELRALIKEAFAALLLSNAPERLAKQLSRLRVLLKVLSSATPYRNIDELTAADIKNYGAFLPKHQQYCLRKVKEILVAWATTGVAGLSRDLLLLLPGLETTNHVVGSAVRTMDPAAGPLTDIEYEAVVAAVRHAYASGSMPLMDYALVILAITLGARALQLAMIKVKDLSVTQRADGSQVFILQVTRLKQGKNIRPRTLFRPRRLAPAVGALIEQQAAAARVWAIASGIPIEEAPLFSSTSSAPQARRVVLPELRGHREAKMMSAKISQILEKLGVHSHRTDGPMRLFQTRLRRTLGSRAAAEGHSASVIADLMDHSWVDSSLVYIETRPDMIDRIDKALALQIAPLAQAFAGTLVERPLPNSAASTGKIVHILTPESIEQAGKCGKFDFCGLAAPLACYTCAYFNPWQDDIHETLLETLIAERDQLLRSADARIASVNDRTILAVADVVNRCKIATGKES
jgi:integrase